MILIILYVILLCVYFACPLPVRLLILAVNFFIPDPIPIVDEVLMIAGIISKIIALDNILEFIDYNWVRNCYTYCKTDFLRKGFIRGLI